MVNEITVGEIGIGITFIVGLLTGIKYLRGHLTEWVHGALKEPLSPIEKSIAEIKEQIGEVHEQIGDVSLDSQKNFLVVMLANAEKGIEWDEVERERFWEQLDKYQKQGGNSYIMDKVEKLKNQRKI